MGCEVCIGGGDFEPVSNLEEESRISDGIVRCTECREIIPVGQEYEFRSYEFDGEEFKDCTCKLCEEIGNTFSCGEGRVYGTLWQDMAQIAFPELTTGSECFRELSSAAKQRVLDKWNEWKFSH